MVARLHQAGMNHTLSTHFNAQPLCGLLLNVFTLINTQSLLTKCRTMWDSYLFLPPEINEYIFIFMRIEQGFDEHS